jgi:hypothetical protein
LAQVVDKQVLRGQVPPAIKELNLKPTDSLPATDRLRLAIGLPLRNPEELRILLSEIYDPAGPRFHQYLTPEQFTERFGPAEKDYEVLAASVEAHGLRVVMRHPNRMLLDVEGSVTDIEKAFHLKLGVYKHPTESRSFYAPDAEPTLNLAVPVLSVSGLNNYSLPRPRISKAARIDGLRPGRPLFGSGPSGTYMGNDFRNAFVPGVTLDGSGQSVGLLEFDGLYAKDITAYESLAGIPKVRIKIVLLDGYHGTPSPYGGEVEVALDIEMAISMAPGLQQVLVYEAGTSGNWHDILNAMATDNLAKQLSCSWYIPNGGPDPVADQIFQQMAAQGQSFFNASGDGDAFTGLVSFPGDNPYITQVGGTTLFMTTNGGSYISESVWNWNNGSGSGGGISTSYPLPSWQELLNLGTSHGSGQWRNVPDVAMPADNVFVVANNGSQYNVGGTSCAAPLWAGFAALVNQQAAAAGRPSIGFVNPAIYAIGAQAAYPITFHDITIGNNTNANSPTEFQAVPGYDLCTGWGSPNGAQTITALADTDGLSLAGPTTPAIRGQVGGPFTLNSQTVTLLNRGTTTLSWQASSSETWLSVSPSGGTLSSSQSVVLTISLNPSVSNLTAGFYQAALWFTNSGSGFVQARQLTLALAAGNYGGAVLALNPAAYWPLNETNSVPAADVVANSGTLGSAADGFGIQNPLRGEPGIVGQSYRFANSNLDAGYFGPHVDVPFNPALNPNGAWTIEVWAMPAQAVYDLYCPASSVDLSQNGQLSRFGWVIYQWADAWDFRVGNINGYIVTNRSSAPIIGSWNHLVGVYDGANISLYLNGQLADGPSPAPGFTANTNFTVPLRFGATTLTNREFNGWVDEAAFYNYALGADRIADHYNTGSSNPGSYAAEILADQPLGYWHLDEAPYSPPATLPVAVNLGYLGSGANGTYQPGSHPGVPGVPAPGFGAGNTACGFSGAGDVEVGGWAPDFTGPLSLVLWVKPAPADGYAHTIAGKGAYSCLVSIDGSGYPHFSDGFQPLGDLIGPARIDDGGWHQLAGIYDGGSNEYFYVDGQLAASSSVATSAIPPTANSFLIGADPDGEFYQLFNGSVDEVAVFTNALTGAQVQQLYAASAYILNASPIFQQVVNDHGTLRLAWSALKGRSYQVQFASSIDQPVWNNLGLPILATGSVINASYLITAPQRYYRLQLLP